jgi:uncharacterized membrane protein YhaH (DUF805 family)
MSYFLKCITSKYAQSVGRASRAEFWYFMLFLVGVEAIARVLDNFVLVWRPVPNDPKILPITAAIAGLFLLLPSVAVYIRRLHDTNRSGLWFLVQVVPVIGWIVSLVFLRRLGTSGPNRFGPDPLERVQQG